MRESESERRDIGERAPGTRITYCRVNKWCIDGQVRCAIGVPASVSNICLTKTEKAAHWLEARLDNTVENLA